MKHQKHRMKKSRWIEGVLQTEIILFESLEEALIEANLFKGWQIKIYNEMNELVHSQNNGYDHGYHTYA